MTRSFKFEKKLILSALAIILLADMVLAVVSYRLAADNQASQKQSLAEARSRKKLLESAVQRANNIRASLPQVQKQCDAFEESFRPSSRGYSGILADIAQIAHKAGLSTEAIAFRQEDLQNRGMVKVEVAAVVAGDYTSVVRFINGLQRSETFYILDNLSLASSAETRGASVKLNLHLKTYFRA
ncbi:MAG TPA: type 4a pilus biogenesis protein PilO [Candidatus Dormibacteraeota bacterium]|nr:type 4a pilus biogenesis protein PilO [Candidatus Dormibacteraeota bacterium]